MNKEKQIKEIMRDVDCSREEALEIWELEQKVKENGTDKIYAQSTKPRSQAKRTPKADTAKIALIQQIYESLANSEGIENLSIANAQREVTFHFEQAEYSVVLTKHRPTKGSQ